MTREAPVARTVNLPSLYKKQADALYPDKRFSIIEGSTKSGKTAGCMIWQLSQLLTRKAGANHWWVAPVYGQARIAFRRAKRDFEQLILSANDTEMRIVLKPEFGGAAWEFRSGEKPDNLFGEEVETVVIDEASRLREEAWLAARSTLTSTQGPARIIGNVKGRGNWFFTLARRAEAGEKGYHYAKLTAQDAVDGGILNPEELLQAQRDLPESVYRELYFCEPADGAHNPFGLSALANAYTKDLLVGEPVVWGLDLARSVDWTVLIGLDEQGNVAKMIRLQVPWNDAYEVIKKAVGSDPVLVDATGIGDPIINELQNLDIDAMPLVFTSQSKQNLMQGLRFAFTDGAIKHNNSTLNNELESFEYKYSISGRVQYSAPEGMHDDAVMALALAWKHGQDQALVGRASTAATDRLLSKDLLESVMVATQSNNQEPAQAGLVFDDKGGVLVVRSGAELIHYEEFANADPLFVIASASNICGWANVSALVFDEAGIGATVRQHWQGQAALVGANTRLPPPKDLYLLDDNTRPISDRFVTLGDAALWELRLRAQDGELALGEDRYISSRLRFARTSEGRGGRVAIQRSGRAGQLVEAIALAYAERTITAGAGLAVWV